MVVKKLMKQEWYPNPHNFSLAYFHDAEPSVVKNSTMIPIIMHDEANAPSSLKVHPENASFAESGKPNCYPESKINFVDISIRFTLTKHFLETDKLHAIRMAIMPIKTAFINDLTAIDELSQDEVQDILELQSESTDRQTYPLYNGNKMVELATGTATLHADVPGLTTTQVLEGIAFDPNAFYDALHYKTIAGKLKATTGGLKWFVLTRDKPTVQFHLRLPSKTKRINPYTFLGLITHCPAPGNKDQLFDSTDSTSGDHVLTNVNIRYNEWNQDFDFSKV